MPVAMFVYKSLAMTAVTMVTVLGMTVLMVLIR